MTHLLNPRLTDYFTFVVNRLTSDRWLPVRKKIELTQAVKHSSVYSVFEILSISHSALLYLLNIQIYAWHINTLTFRFCQPIFWIHVPHSFTTLPLEKNQLNRHMLILYKDEKVTCDVTIEQKINYVIHKPPTLFLFSSHKLQEDASNLTIQNGSTKTVR